MIKKALIKLLVRKIITLQELPKSGYGSLYINYEPHTGYEIQLITQEKTTTPFQSKRLMPKEMYDTLCTAIAKIKKEKQLIENLQNIENDNYTDEQIAMFVMAERCVN